MLRYSTSARGGTPERFVEIDPATGVTTQVETDTDHDGRRERLEMFVKGRLIRAEIDSDSDGKRDRVQIWENGSLDTEVIDRDGDGKADIRILHNKSGAITKVERLNR